MYCVNVKEDVKESVNKYLQGVSAAKKVAFIQDTENLIKSFKTDDPNELGESREGTNRILFTKRSMVEFYVDEEKKEVCLTYIKPLKNRKKKA